MTLTLWANEEDGLLPVEPRRRDPGEDADDLTSALLEILDEGQASRSATRRERDLIEAARRDCRTRRCDHFGCNDQ